MQVLTHAVMVLWLQVVAGGLMRRDAEGFPCVDAASGPTAAAKHARAVFGFACAMLRAAADHTYPHSGQPVKLRVGIHSGPIVSGVVGAWHALPCGPTYASVHGLNLQPLMCGDCVPLHASLVQWCAHHLYTPWRGKALLHNAHAIVHINATTQHIFI